MLHIAIDRMTASICSILSGESPSVYLYGSAASNDFQYGWSDIDILCLTGRSIAKKQAQALLELRQGLVQKYNDSIYRFFEGAFQPINAPLSNKPDRIVYWGTSDQRLTDRYDFTSYSMVDLKTHGKLLCGTDIRSRFPMPSHAELRRDVILHYQTIRKYAVKTDGSLYACGWLLDIARCLYTLQTGAVIPKTQAGEWALSENICTAPDTLQKALKVRRNPLAYKDTQQYKAWASGLGPDIQNFADVLERAIG